MATKNFDDLLNLAYSASESLNAVESAQQLRVDSLFSRYQSGLITYGTLRTELIRQAHAGFVAGGSVAAQHISGLIDHQGITGYRAPAALEQSPVLDRILSDLVANLEAHRDSARDETSFRRLKFRAGLGIQTAARRGFTENQLAAAHTLAAQGAQMRKMWLCSFTSNTPCASCLKLHGADVAFDEEFDHGDEHAPKIFLGLQGPPRHPNCHCYMVVYLEVPDMSVSIPGTPFKKDEKYMSVKDVRKLPKAVFTAALTTLRLIAGILKGGMRG